MYFKCIEHYRNDTSICISMNKNITEYQAKVGTAGHRFYFDDNIKFINIPKCASTAIKKYKLELTNKFVVIREPYSRLHSSFKHVIQFEDISMSNAILYLTGQKTIDDHHTACAMMHFIPASFFIECSKIFCNKPYDIFKLENLNFKKAHTNPATEYDEIISNWINQNDKFIQKFYEQDIELYNANE